MKNGSLFIVVTSWNFGVNKQQSVKISSVYTSMHRVPTSLHKRRIRSRTGQIQDQTFESFCQTKVQVRPKTILNQGISTSRLQGKKNDRKIGPGESRGSPTRVEERDTGEGGVVIPSKKCNLKKVFNLERQKKKMVQSYCCCCFLER